VIRCLMAPIEGLALSDSHNHDEPDLTGFLRGLGRGDDTSAVSLMPFVYEELKAIALGYLGGGAAGTLHPTALVHEAFLKLFDHESLELADRKHFFRLAAKAMRQLIIDHARHRGRMKRGGGGRAVTLDEAIAAATAVEFDWLDLDLALTELSTLDERQGQIVELHYYAGLEVSEVADVLGVSKSTVERDLRASRAWLGLKLQQVDP